MKITVKIKPGCKKQDLNMVKDMFENEIYEIKLKSLPKDGEANKELVEVLSEHFNVAKNKVQIKSGLTSRNKVVLIK